MFGIIVFLKDPIIIKKVFLQKVITRSDISLSPVKIPVNVKLAFQIHALKDNPRHEFCMDASLFCESVFYA